MDKYSEVLLWGLRTARSGVYRKNDIVLIRYDLAAVKMAEILQGKLLDMGINTVLRVGLTTTMDAIDHRVPDCGQPFTDFRLAAPSELVSHHDVRDPTRIGFAVRKQFAGRVDRMRQWMRRRHLHVMFLDNEPAADRIENSIAFRSVIKYRCKPQSVGMKRELLFAVERDVGIGIEGNFATA